MAKQSKCCKHTDEITALTIPIITNFGTCNFEHTYYNYIASGLGLSTTPYEITYYIHVIQVYFKKILSTRAHIYYKYKKQLQKIERKVGMEYQKAYKQG